MVERVAIWAATKVHVNLTGSGLGLWALGLGFRVLG